MTGDTGAGDPRAPSTALRAFAAVALLYLFLVGVGLLEDGIEGLGAGFTDALFERVANPVSGVFVGVLTTVLVQSSSVTTSTIVGLVAAGALTVEFAVPMVMGANIGTSVTNTLASVGSIRRREEFRRAVEAATVHDFFNVLTVVVLLPLELSTGFLRRTATFISEQLAGTGGTSFKSPIKTIVKAPVGWINDAATSMFGEGTATGVVLLIVGLAAIFTALAYLTRIMRSLIADRLETSINRVLEGGRGLMAMLVGLVMTVAVQSSSITTSVLVPLAAAGVLTLPALYPVTLGANIGTTITALLASLATDSPAALTVALVHVLFNLSGVLLFYVPPLLRDLPLRAARALADRATRNRAVLPTYIIGTFIILPLVGVILLA